MKRPVCYSRGQCLSVCELPGQLFHSSELTEAVTFAQAQLCVCVCARCFPDGLLALHYHNRGLIALSDPLNTKNILKYPIICPFLSCLLALRGELTQTQAHDSWIGFVWVHCSLCLEYILIAKDGGCPIFNCLHARLLLLLVCQEEITESSKLSSVFLLRLLSDTKEQTDCQNSLMCCCRINVLVEIVIVVMTLSAPKTLVLNDDYTLFSPWKAFNRCLFFSS